jgi:hypothetical protein
MPTRSAIAISSSLAPATAKLRPAAGCEQDLSVRAFDSGIVSSGVEVMALEHCAATVLTSGQW